MSEIIRTAEDENTYKAIEFENGFVAFQGLRYDEWRNIAMYDVEQKAFLFVDHLKDPMYSEHLTATFQSLFLNEATS